MPASGPVPLRPNAPRWRRTAEVLSETNSKISRDKSFADDLNKERGIVRSRVALLLRSSEIKPFVLQICVACCECVRRVGQSDGQAHSHSPHTHTQHFSFLAKSKVSPGLCVLR